MSVLCIRSPRSTTLARRRAGGSAAVEAAIMMPFLLTIIFASINLLIICGKSLRFQYDFAQVTRRTFTTKMVDRQSALGNTAPSWENYFVQLLQDRAQQASLSMFPKSSSNQSCSRSLPGITKCQFTTPTNGSVNWNSQGPIPRGSVFYGEAESTEPILPAGFPWMSSLTITLKARAVSVVQMGQGE